MQKQELIEKIGYFYAVNYKDSYHDVITQTGFVRVESIGDTVILIVRRPGILIGKRGENIEKLSNHLGCNLKIIEDDEQTLTDKLIFAAKQNDPKNYSFDDLEYEFSRKID